jgi:drug/metabolite transporter (DMT)-like permease
MLATMFCFVALDTAMKYALVDMGFSLVQVVWARFFFATLIALAAIGPRLAQVAVSARPGIQFTRSILLMVTTILFNIGIMTTPLATGSTIMFLSPFLVTILSIPFLGERVGPRRWAGIGVGFLGALIVVKPEPGHIGIGVLFLLASALTNATYQVATRKLHAADGAMTSFLYTAMAGAVLSSLIVPWHWQSPDLLGWALLVFCGLAGGVGHLCLIQSFRRAPASAVVPFSYSSLVWATGFGLVVFGEWPPMTTFIGAGIIIATGLYIFHRERAAAKVAG